MKIKVLIVEDNQNLQNLLRSFLEENVDGSNDFEYEVVAVAEDKANALVRFDEFRPDVITMDHDLAHGDNGLDVANSIRERDPKVLIIMISAWAEKFEGRGLAKGSFGLQDLRDYLAKVLSGGG